MYNDYDVNFVSLLMCVRNIVQCLLVFYNDKQQQPQWFKEV